MSITDHFCAILILNKHQLSMMRYLSDGGEIYRSIEQTLSSSLTHSFHYSDFFHCRVDLVLVDRASIDLTQLDVSRPPSIRINVTSLDIIVNHYD